MFCTAGRVWGGLQGTDAFKMPTPPQPSGAVPTISFFTGDSVITTKSGDLVYGKDTGALDFGPGGGFASLITFTGGTGAMQNASGQIRLRGQLDPLDGTTSGDYLGLPSALHLFMPQARRCAMSANQRTITDNCSGCVRAELWAMSSTLPSPATS